ncbi:MAG: methyltransferase domain-containing protein [Acidimicrobiales bacterium]
MGDHDDPEAAAAKAHVAEIFSTTAADYDQVLDFFRPFGRALVAAADVRPGHTVLDVASGRGACLHPALEAVGPGGRVLGIDLAPGMVEHLTADLAARGVRNAEVRVGDAEAIDLPDASVDVVTAGFMIFFCPDPDRVLSELHRVLKAGGTVAISTFDGDTPSKWVRTVAEEIFGPNDGRAAEAFDRVEVLEPAMAHAGFRDLTGIDVFEPVRYESLAHLEAWHRSHFMRSLLDALDEDQLALYRRRMAEHLEPNRTERGYELTQRARITTGRR